MEKIKVGDVVQWEHKFLGATKPMTVIGSVLKIYKTATGGRVGNQTKVASIQVTTPKYIKRAKKNKTVITFAKLEKVV